MARWPSTFAERGLVMIWVDDGTADPLDRLKKHVEEGKIPHPVLWDKGAKNFRAYGIYGTPAGYLIGVDGKVLWEGYPNLRVREIEKILSVELPKVKAEDLQRWKKGEIGGKEKKEEKPPEDPEEREGGGVGEDSGEK